jgi:hypothetical protein
MELKLNKHAGSQRQDCTESTNAPTRAMHAEVAMSNLL